MVISESFSILFYFSTLVMLLSKQYFESILAEWDLPNNEEKRVKETCSHVLRSLNCNMSVAITLTRRARDLSKQTY